MGLKKVVKTDPVELVGGGVGLWWRRSGQQTLRGRPVVEVLDGD